MNTSSRAIASCGRIQVRLRLMSTTARDDLPEDPRELAKLAGLLRYDSPQALLADCQRYTAENRRRLRAAVRTGR